MYTSRNGTRTSAKASSYGTLVERDRGSPGEIDGAEGDWRSKEGLAVTYGNDWLRRFATHFTSQTNNFLTQIYLKPKRNPFYIIETPALLCLKMTILPLYYAVEQAMEQVEDFSGSA